MSEIAYIFRFIAVLQIIKDPSSRRFGSHSESIIIYLAPIYKETKAELCKPSKLTNNYRSDIIRGGVTKNQCQKMLPHYKGFSLNANKRRFHAFCHLDRPSLLSFVLKIRLHSLEYLTITGG